MAMNFTGLNGCHIDVATYYNQNTTYDLPANTGAVTITCWFNYTGTADTIQTVIAKGYVMETVFSIDHLDVSGTRRIRVLLETNSGGVVLNTLTTTTHTCTLGQTYFVCLWYDGSNLKIFADAVEIASAGASGIIQTNSSVPCYIGDYPLKYQRFVGIIDDIRVYTRALSIPEMQTIYYSQGRDNIVQGLHSKWPLNESHFGNRSPAVSSIKDLSGGHKNGTEFSSYALNFVAASSNTVNITGSYTDFQLVAPFTIEAWIRPDSTTAVQRFFGTRNGSNGIGVGINGSAQMLLTVFGVANYATTSTPFTVGQWCHVAYVFDSTNDVTFYYNGSYLEKAAGSAVPGTTINSVKISSDGGGLEYWNGAIDELVVFKGATRSSAQVALDMKELPILDANIVGLWRMTDGTGTSLTDFSGNNHRGDITGATWINSGIAAPVYSNPLAIK